MLGAVAALAAEHGVACQLAMEGTQWRAASAVFYGCAVKIDALEAAVRRGPRRGGEPCRRLTLLAAADAVRQRVGHARLVSGTREPRRSESPRDPFHLDPREGNPLPDRRDAGMVNSIGLANPRPLDRFLEHDLPGSPSSALRSIASVGGMVPRRVRDGGGANGARARRSLRWAAQRVVSERGSGTEPGETRALVERCRDEHSYREALAERDRGIATAAARTSMVPQDRDGPGDAAAPPGWRRWLSQPQAVEPVALAVRLPRARAATGLPIIGMGGVAGAGENVHINPGRRAGGDRTPSSGAPSVVGPSSVDIERRG